VNDSDPKPLSHDSVVARVIGLAGSLRSGSATQMAVRYALLGAEKHGAQTQLLDIASYDLPFLGREKEPKGRTVVERFLGDIRAADGIVLGSPEIHGSLSGILKNTLDLIERHAFEGKMLGLIGVAGGQMGASETLSHLRAIAHSLHAWVVPAQVSIGGADKAFNSRGEPVDAGVRDRLLSVGSQVARFAWLHKCENHLQFVREWEVAATGDAEAAS
jgi:NAD(P)H-dependent FMN reductase